MKRVVLIVVLSLLTSRLTSYAQQSTVYGEQYRPQIHFSPKANWTNDPNGMVYYNEVYHLFYQYYPKGTTWGPMHWGHATSKDLIHWDEKAIALYPDRLGYIFSGSAVADVKNTSGFGEGGKVPLVAIFTHHNAILEKTGAKNFQNQSLAYSLDDGQTWIKYTGNPVLKNPGINDFRDPKVRWFPEYNKWIMTLATKDRITFYGSKDLKDWKKESEFGATVGAHGGVWECPDLFPLTLQGKTYWILLVSINPGGPNGGSGTQYFVGEFDGKTFKSINSMQKWIDYGPDDYAGVTWSGTGKRAVFLGWMSNWLYANEVPTVGWRNAMTIPRELSLTKVGGHIFLASQPVKEINMIKQNSTLLKAVKFDKTLDLTDRLSKISGQFLLKFSISQMKDFQIILSNEADEHLVVGYDKKMNQYYIDRKKSGTSSFQKDFSGRFTAPRLAVTNSGNVTLVVDVTSVEFFADGGLTTMTSLFFPSKTYDKIHVQAPGSLRLDSLTIDPLKSIWE